MNASEAHYIADQVIYEQSKYHKIEEIIQITLSDIYTTIEKQAKSGYYDYTYIPKFQLPVQYKIYEYIYQSIENDLTKNGYGFSLSDDSFYITW